MTSAARAQRGHPAVVWDGGTLSYGELAERAADTLGTLPPVAPCLEPAGASFAVTLHGAWMAGGAIMPLAPGSDASVARKLGGLTPPEGTLAVLHTSGTTGEPRPVCLTRANFEASAQAGAAVLPIGPGDRWLCCLPVFHVGGLSIFTRCALSGATVVAEPHFDPARIKDLLETGGATVVSLVPTMLHRLREAGLGRAPGVRGILLGGGPIPAELLDWSRELGLPVMPTYGMTETCSQIATAAPGERLARPLPGADIRIADDGEILVRGPMVAADGWFHTGDRGRMTDDRLLEVEGRMDDLIVTGGENVAAREVEQALLAHAGVSEAAVIGVEDPEWGRAVTAFVVATVSEAELIAHCRQRLAGFKVPKRVVVVAELPRSAAGKVARAALESRAHDLRQGR